MTFSTIYTLCRCAAEDNTPLRKRWTEVTRTMDRCCVRPWCLLLITCSPLVHLFTSSTSLSATTELDGATAWHSPCTTAAASRAILMDARKRFDVQFFTFSQNQASRRAQHRLKLVDQFITYSCKKAIAVIESLWNKRMIQHCAGIDREREREKEREREPRMTRSWRSC